MELGAPKKKYNEDWKECIVNYLDRRMERCFFRLGDRRISYCRNLEIEHGIRVE
jgi:hypothetical protein